MNLHDVAVIDDGHRVTARPLFVEVLMRRQVQVIFRVIGDRLHLRLLRKVHEKPIVAAVVLDPFLGESGRGEKHN
ncbi:MAG: hypothetical protein DMF88_11555 [Acidobacteria bacterium]|nr:MAG: hypothetical protein DMF88_11555 [Acidobacteriota bacterium]